MDSRSPALPSSAQAPGAWGEANARGVAFAAIADWRQAAAAFGDAASTLSHEALHGAPTDALALVLSNLAHACARDGRAEEALDHAHRALAVREALAGAASPLAARTRMDLAVLLASTGALEEARSLLDTALRQLETSFGTGDVRLLGVLENSARLFLMTGEVERAATDVRRLRGVMELHEVPTDRLVALTDRLRAAGAPVDEAIAERHLPPYDQANEEEASPGSGETWSRGEETGGAGWLPTDSAELELPTPWVPDAAPQLLWDAGDGTALEAPSPDVDSWGAGQLEEEAPLVPGGDLMSPPAHGDADDTAGASFGLAGLLDEDFGEWPSMGPDSESADTRPSAPPVTSPMASAMHSLVEDHLGAMAAELPTDDAAASLWSTLLEGDGDAADSLEASQVWELPEASPWAEVEAASAGPAIPLLASASAPLPTPQDDDIPWLDAGTEAPQAGRLLDEPEPEIPDFLRADQTTPSAGHPAVAAPPALPTVPAAVGVAWEDEDAPSAAPDGAHPGRPQPGLLPLVPDGARWGQTGASTPHEGSVAVYPSPVSKYDEILQRVRTQALQHRAANTGAPLTGGRTMVLSVITVAAVGVGGGLWWTLLR
jgi:hypothetical protein